MEPHWTSYVGMATGIIGAISGIAGAIMGYVSYKRSNLLKSQDLRIELRKAVNVFRSDSSLLEERIEDADKSRQSVAEANGRLRSGMMEKWKEGVDVDKTTICQLFENAPGIEEIYDNLNPKDLESKLVEMHSLQLQIDCLRKKYDQAIQSDDEERRHLREDVRRGL